MAYVAQTDLKGLIPDDWVAGAMDDAEDDEAADSGVWDSVSDAVDDEIDGRLGPCYATPVDPAPAVLKAAAKAIACWLLYKRYGRADEANPWTELAKEWRARLDRIGRGQEPLTWDSAGAAGGGDAITETMKTYPEAGAAMV